LEEDGLFAYESSNVVLDHFIAMNDQLISTNQTLGMRFNDYYANNVLIQNANIEGMQIGIDPSTNTAGSAFTIQNSHLQNYIDVELEPLWTSGSDPIVIGARKVIINNVIFDNLNLASLPWGPEYAIQRSLSGATGNVQNLVQLDQIYVYNYNGVTGDNFRVYYAQQTASAVLEQSIYRADGSIQVLASPVSGLTNQQNWTTYGIALAGEIAPATATTMTGIDGLINPF